jgi:hypothetical protein
MEAIHIAAGKISMGSGKVFICGGVESMTRVNTGFDSMPYPYTEKENPNVYFSMGITAENVAKQYSITRKEQQEFAIFSHTKAFEAQSKGNFINEIVSMIVTRLDECAFITCTYDCIHNYFQNFHSKYVSFEMKDSKNTPCYFVLRKRCSCTHHNPVGGPV